MKVMRIPNTHEAGALCSLFSLTGPNDPFGAWCPAGGVSQIRAPGRIFDDCLVVDVFFHLPDVTANSHTGCRGGHCLATRGLL